jgi:hypothetical protein
VTSTGYTVEQALLISTSYTVEQALLTSTGYTVEQALLTTGYTGFLYSVTGRSQQGLL